MFRLRSKRPLLVILLMMAFVSISEAQNLRLVDASDNKAIEGANVLVGELPVLISDAKGEVVIDGLDNNELISISHAGYADTSLTIAEVRASSNILQLIPAVITMRPFDIISPREKAIDIPQKVDVILPSEIENKDPRTSADMLERSGSIFVQRSQLGGGSPVIRGFEANRILLVIDGVKMNNAIYRSGHLHNAISVDPNILSETEVTYGPASLLYGSDALGGVIHFKTQKPELRKGGDSTLLRDAGAMMRYSSAANETTAHADFTVGGGKVSWLSSVTYGRFDDLRMGRRRSHGDQQWGLVNVFVDTENAQDSIRENQDPNVQIGTGYEQLDLYNKILFALDDSVDLTISSQLSSSSYVPRFDRLNDRADNGDPRFARWDYGPQNRFLVSARLDIKTASKVFDKVQTIFSFQQVEESRISRRTFSEDEVHREEEVQVVGVNVDMSKRFKMRDFHYGIQMNSNRVFSDAWSQNIRTLDISPSASRYPDAGSSMSSIGAYAVLNTKVDEKLRYQVGLRYSHSFLNSSFEETTFYTLPFDEVNLANGALTYSAGATRFIGKSMELNLLSSSGFRAPNVDDIGKVFERDGLVTVPNDFLRPEHTINGELSIGSRSQSERAFDFRLTGFYTHIIDAIVQREFSLNGNDSLLIDGELARIVTNKNASSARIVGADISLGLKTDTDWKLGLKATYTQGSDLEEEVPLAHIPPFFGRLSVSKELKRLLLSFDAMYNSKKKSSDIARGRTDNPSEGLNGEFPSWYTLNVNASFDLTEYVQLNVGVENILDEHYKAFASGLSAAGRNYIFSIRANLSD